VIQEASCIAYFAATLKLRLNVRVVEALGGCNTIKAAAPNFVAASSAAYKFYFVSCGFVKPEIKFFRQNIRGLVSYFE
jgi:hypothetical protein